MDKNEMARLFKKLVFIFLIHYGIIYAEQNSIQTTTAQEYETRDADLEYDILDYYADRQPPCDSACSNTNLMPNWLKRLLVSLLMYVADCNEYIQKKWAILKENLIKTQWNKQ